jgi:hypothetical protein
LLLNWKSDLPDGCQMRPEASVKNALDKCELRTARFVAKATSMRRSLIFHDKLTRKKVYPKLRNRHFLFAEERNITVKHGGRNAPRYAAL